MINMTSSQVDYLHQADLRRQQVFHHLLFLCTQLQLLSHTMARAKNSPAQARWTPQEVSVLIDYLHAHRFEHGDGGNFKDSTISGAVEHLKQFHPGGKPKDAKCVRYKWGAVCFCLEPQVPFTDRMIQLRHILDLIDKWLASSGVPAWHPDKGANIKDDDMETGKRFDAFCAKKVWVLLSMYHQYTNIP